MASPLITVGLGLDPSALITLGLGSFGDGLPDPSSTDLASIVSGGRLARNFWLAATADAEISGLSLVSVVGETVTNGRRLLQVEKLDPDNLYTKPIAAVGPGRILAGKQGYVSMDWPAWVRIGGNSLDPGDKCGPTSDDGTIRSSGHGFICLEAVGGSLKRAKVLPSLAGRKALFSLLELTAALSSGDSTASVTETSPWSGVATSPTSVTNHSYEGDSGDEALAFWDWVGGDYELVHVEGFQCDCQCEFLPYSDDFSSQDERWELLNSSITSGEAVVGAGDNSTLIRCARTPVGTGWSITLESTIATLPTAFSIGAQRGDFGIMDDQLLLHFTLAPYLTAGSPPTPTSYKWEAGASSGTISVVPANSDVLKIVVTENSGSFDVDFYINDSLEHSENSVSYSFSRSFNYGYSGLPFAGEFHWDDLSVTKG